MKYIVLWLLLASTSVYAQSTNDSTKTTESDNFKNKNLNYKFLLKIYNTTSIQKNAPVLNSYFNNESKTYVFLHPTISAQWKTRNKHFNEIELTAFELGKENTYVTPSNNNYYYGQSNHTFTEKKSFIGIKYEYILSLNTTKNYKLVPFIGAGLYSFYTNIKNHSTESSNYDRNNQLLGTTFYIAPRLTYFLTSNLVLDFNIPIYLIEFNVSTLHSKIVNYNGNPFVLGNTLNYTNKTTQTFNFKAFPNLLSCRLGIGLKI